MEHEVMENKDMNGNVRQDLAQIDMHMRTALHRDRNKEPSCKNLIVSLMRDRKEEALVFTMHRFNRPTFQQTTK